MKELSDKKTFDVNKLNKNLLKEYIKSYNYTIQNNNKENSNQNEKLLVYVLTFNIQGGIPTKDEIPLLFPKQEKIENFDIFVINTQECLRSISASFFNDSKEEWVEALTAFFGDKFINLINSNLGALHIATFIKKEKATYFSDLRNGDIKTGFLNIMANKGAVSTSMKYYDKHILFICCHLTAGQEKKIERNNDLIRITNNLQNSIDIDSKAKLKSLKNSIKKNKKLLLSKSINTNSLIRYRSNENINGNKLINSLINKPSKKILDDEIDDKYEQEEKNNIKINIEEIEEKESLEKTNKNNKEKINSEKDNVLKEINNKSISSISSIDTTKDKTDKFIDDYDIVILSGDLNYRINIETEKIKDIMDKNDPEILWDKDQFSEEIKKKHKFKEGVKRFMPTYKYKKNSKEYDYSRIPGWTDRILYKSKRFHDILLCEYSSIDELLISDHRPVYAIFKINCKDKKYINNKFHKNGQECCII